MVLYKNITEELLQTLKSHSTCFSTYPCWFLRFANHSSRFANLIVITDLSVVYFLPYGVLGVIAFLV